MTASLSVGHRGVIEQRRTRRKDWHGGFPVRAIGVIMHAGNRAFKVNLDWPVRDASKTHGTHLG